MNTKRVKIHVDRSSGVPIHDQIKEQVVGHIHAGQLRTGDQLPTIRGLSIALAVNVNTVARAYRELDAQGIIATRRGEGTFVAATPGEDELRRLRAERLARLVAGLVDEAERLGFSRAEVVRAVADRAAATPSPTEESR